MDKRDCQDQARAQLQEELSTNISRQVPLKRISQTAVQAMLWPTTVEELSLRPFLLQELPELMKFVLLQDISH